MIKERMATVSEARRAPRGSYAKSAEVREQILDAAVEVFSELGFHASSMRQIARRVDMSLTGVLHHFPAKDGLMIEVLRQRDEWQFERNVTAVRSPAEVITETIRVTRSNMGEAGATSLYAVLSAEATVPDHPAHEYFRQRYRRMVGRFTDVFDELRDTGELLVEESPASLARQLIALLDGLQVQWLFDAEHTDMADELQRFLFRVVHPSVLDQMPEPPTTRPGRRAPAPTERAGPATPPRSGIASAF